MEENSDLNFSELPNSELLRILHKNETECLLLHKEKDLYEFILNEKKNLFQNYLATEEYNLSSLKTEDVNELKYVEKCHFIKKCQACLVRILEIKDIHRTTELQELKFKLELSNNKLLLLKDEADQFKIVILMKSKHPITKKIILQRVQKYFHDSIQNKMSMANRIKTQIESFTMERHKILKQMKEQKKRLASLDAVKYQETKLEYLRICEFLVEQREHLAKCKYKFNSLAAHVAEMKKTLIEQEKNIIEMKSEVMKMEETKTTMNSERVRNEKEIHNLNEAMRKIKLDPRSHDLPEIFEYAIIKRQNESLKHSIKHWKKKLTIAEELKLVHLNKQLKKKR